MISLISEFQTIHHMEIDNYVTVHLLPCAHFHSIRNNWILITIPHNFKLNATAKILTNTNSNKNLSVEVFKIPVPSPFKLDRNSIFKSNPRTILKAKRWNYSTEQNAAVYFKEKCIHRWHHCHHLYHKLVACEFHHLAKQVIQFNQ